MLSFVLRSVRDTETLGLPKVELDRSVPLGPRAHSPESNSFISLAILFPPPAAKAARLSEVSDAQVFRDESELTTELVPFGLTVKSMPSNSNIQPHIDTVVMSRRAQ